jgi:hypothetical protein
MKQIKQMKQIKVIYLTISLLLFSLLGFSQSTPTGQMRIQTRTTEFGQNLPIGTQIYVVSDSTLWQTRFGINLTGTITRSLDSLMLINNSSNYIVDKFEAASTPTTYTLTYMPKIATTGVTVMMNGAALRPTIDYTTSNKTLTIISSQIQYDVFVVSYLYYR